MESPKKPRVGLSLTSGFFVPFNLDRSEYECLIPVCAKKSYVLCGGNPQKGWS